MIMENKQQIKQLRVDNLFLDLAERISRMSHAQRKKVGAVMVSGDNIVGMGWNGTPAGDENTCEDENGVTKPTVIHAEMNLICKAAKSVQSSVGSTVYVTLSPCLECAKLIRQSQVSRVVYREEYRDRSGIDFLQDRGIQVEQITNG